MPWGELTLYGWVGLGVGVLGLLPGIFALLASNQIADGLRRGKRTPEDLEQLTEDAKSLHWAVALALLAYVALFTMSQFGITQP